MKNIIWLFPLAGALLGFAASYLAFYLKFRLAPAPGYTRLNYRAIESFNLKSALFSAVVLMVLVMGAAGGYPYLKNLRQVEPEKGPRGFTPMPRDSLIRLIPQPPSLDPKDNPGPEFPEIIKRPAPGSKIVLVEDDVADTLILDDQTNRDIVNAYSRNSTPATDSLIKNAVIGDNSDLPYPGVFVPHSQAPVVLNAVRPVYPSICRNMGAEGRVILQALVDKSGNVAKVRVLKSSGNDALDEAAMEALKASIFSPALQGDKPVAVWLSYPVVFSLE
ncbi:energy transducer TonB [candidate division TA06 bacterium]|uniref:Energy transducer TonB n=1 Tax=candidate division TA06 bacterium TaxID=2250710 RepID=A0A933MJ72_UNCT6|nr:energy transducer TonB [candidate division TA06 bacterium]